MTNAIEGEASEGLPGDLPGTGSSSEDRGNRSVGVLAPIAAVIRAGARVVVNFVDRIVNGIRCIAPLVLGLGCQSTNDIATPAPAVTAISSSTLQSTRDTGPRQLGQFTITFYYVIGEDEVQSKPVMVAANENRANAGSVGEGSDNSDADTQLTSIAADPVTLYAGGGGCQPIAEVSKEFASQLALQGTGKLRDGRVVNIFGACNCKRSPCFKVTQAQWGTSGSGKPLQPFRTVAVDPKVVKLGSLLYVPLLEGKLMPGRTPWGGYVHDGCVVADDTGGHIGGNRLDLFVGRKAYFRALGSGSGGSHAWARHVPVFDGTSICERKGRRVGRKSASI
jgi:3D (Asp-Asp-Asp) domain-containing protein